MVRKETVCLFGLILSVLCAALPARGPAGGPESPAPASAPPAAGEEPLRPGELRFGVTPHLPEKTLRDQYGPVMAYLSSGLGMPVRLVIAGDYADLVRRLREGRVDLAALTPLSYVRAKREDPSLKLLLADIVRGTTSYTAYIIVHRDSGFENLEDLRGKRFVFVDRNSASGYLFPYAFLLERGKDPDTFLGEVLFSGNHVDAVRLVAERKADAAAVSSTSLRAAREAGIRTRSLRIFRKTGRVPHDTICARPGLDPALARRAADLLLALDTRTELGRKTLGEAVGIDGWMEVDDAHYAPIREVLELVEAHDGTAPAR